MLKVKNIFVNLIGKKNELNSETGFLKVKVYKFAHFCMFDKLKFN